MLYGAYMNLNDEAAANRTRSVETCEDKTKHSVEKSVITC